MRRRRVGREHTRAYANPSTVRTLAYGTRAWATIADAAKRLRSVVLAAIAVAPRGPRRSQAFHVEQSNAAIGDSYASDSASASDGHNSTVSLLTRTGTQFCVCLYSYTWTG